MEIRHDLNKAVFKGDLDSIAKIINTKLELNWLDENADTILHYAFRYDADEKVVLLLHSGGSDPFIKNKKGESGFSLASSKTKYPKYLELINSKTKDLFLLIDVKDHSKLKSSLNRENVNSVNSDGDSLLIYAVKKKDVSALNVILQFSPDKSLKDKFGRTARELSLMDEKLSTKISYSL